MSNTVSAGLALAVPVKPDVLGERLEAYAKVIPVLHTLRLCHRFGKAAHITKLPTEIELAVETLIIREEQREARLCSRWASAFRHFEGRCSPMSHLEDCYSPLNDAVEFEECESCQEDHYSETDHCENRCRAATVDKCWTCSQKRDSSNCMRTCEAKIDYQMNEMALDWEWDGYLDGDCENWEAMIDQSDKGSFAKYDKILRQHFGLDVFMSQNRIAEEEAETWPRDINHQWHNKEELKTTTCYLTLAKQFAPPKTYVAGEIEVDLGGAELESTQAIPVKLQPSKDKAKASKRFGRAMNILDIKTYVHASQRTSITMPVYGESSIDAEQQNKHSSATPKIKWPQLVLLVKSRATTPFQ